MKIPGFFIFILVVLVIYFLANMYVFVRLNQSLPYGISKPTVKYIFIVLASLFVVSRFLEQMYDSTFSDIVNIIGVYWLPVMLYSILFIFFIDILRFINYIFPYFPSIVTDNIQNTKVILLIISILITLVMTIGGSINASYTKVNKIEIYNPKLPELTGEVKIALVSDIHFGNILGTKKAHKLVNELNQLNPDIVLIAGDLIDGNIRAVKRKKINIELKMIKTKYGVYAIPGNHDYFANIDSSIKYMESADIKVLKDKVEIIDNSFILIGRDDITVSRSSDNQRATLSQLMLGIENKNLPVILLDHQPGHLDESKENKVDLHLSGHTHNGQLWPFSLITKAIYKHSFGYLKIGDTHFYVSSGYGTWGPPVKIGAQSEIVEITLKSKK